MCGREGVREGRRDFSAKITHVRMCDGYQHVRVQWQTEGVREGRREGHVALSAFRAPPKKGEQV